MSLRSIIKKRLNESLPSGYYTLGDGKVRKIPTEGFSKWYKRDDHYSFRYNYSTKELECYYMNNKIDSLGLEFTDWIDNPDYWVDNYLNQIEDEAHQLGYYEESKGINETQYYFPNGSKATNEDVIDALAYMYGISIAKVKQTIGTYNREDIIKAIAYYSTKGYNPKKKNELYKSNIEDIKSYMGIKESINESEKFVVAYRENGQDKFSSVEANSSSEAIQIFNAAVDKSNRNVNNVHIAVEDVDINEALPPVRDYKVVRIIDNEPTELATVRARNTEEAKANMLLALLDAGYYEDEVEPEIANGTITVKLSECDNTITESDEDDIIYVAIQYIPGGPESGIESDKFEPLFSIPANSREEAQSRLLSYARSRGIDDISNIFIQEYDPEVAAEMLNEVSDVEEKKAYKIRYKYDYVEESDTSPYVRSAIFEAFLIVLANSSEEALDKAKSMSNEIANNTPGIEGEPYRFEIESVYDNLEDYKAKYPRSNIKVVECDDLSESIDYDTYKYYVTIRPETPNHTKMDDLRVKLKQGDILPVYVSAQYSPSGKKYRDSYGWIYLLKSKEDYNKLLDISTEVLGSKDGINVKPLEFNKSEWDIKELNEDLEDDPEVVDQEYTSAATSINSSKVPAVFKMVKFNPKSINLDYGGGKFDNAAIYLKDTYDATNLVYDPYNRDEDHNREVLSIVRENGGADTVTCSNVLNVIKEPAARLAVIRNCKNYLKNGGKAYFTVYEGSAEGAEGPTKAGYQLNKKTSDYVEEISQVFDNVTRKGKLIIAESVRNINTRVIEDSIFDTQDGIDVHALGNRHGEGITLDDLNNAKYSSSMMQDRAELHIDGRTYVKVSEDQWQYIPPQERALGYKVPTEKVWEYVKESETVDLYDPQ